MWLSVLLFPISQVIKCQKNPLSVKPYDRLNRLQFKLEQMAARYKQCETELKAEYQARKSSESKKTDSLKLQVNQHLWWIKKSAISDDLSLLA